MPDPHSRPEPSTVARLQAWGRSRLAGIEASRESELLLGHALQRDRAWLFAHAGDPVTVAQRQHFEQLVQQRERGLPVAHLLGTWGFWSLELEVTHDTLIPRPETELLVEAVLQRSAGDRAIRIADLGTGSGAIALAIASERPLARLVATDASAAALAVAQRNARRNSIDNIEFRAGDWYAPLAGERFELIVSNPPYIAADDPHLLQGDLRFEPATALASGVDGLDAIGILANGALRHLVPRGWLLLEHGYQQGPAVRSLLLGAGLGEVSTIDDLEQRERVSLARAPG